MNYGDLISAATPAISGPTSYEISGTVITLTCMSSSDSSASGTYVWKLATQTVYVLPGLFT